MFASSNGTISNCFEPRPPEGRETREDEEPPDRFRRRRGVGPTVGVMQEWSLARLVAGYARDRVIGRGRYGQAILWQSRGEHDGGPAAVVVKQISLDALNEKEKEQTENEVHVLSTLEHPNVVRCLGSFIDDAANAMCIVLEYADGGTLAGRIQQHAEAKEHIHPELVRNWFAQIICALEHAHDAKVLHRDIKSANIFLTLTNRVKLGDFGVSRQLSESRSLATTVCGTPYYLAPELVRGLAYSRPADVWAAGCVLYEMVTLRRPFAGSNIGELVMNITRGRFGCPEGAPGSLQDATDDLELRALVMAMLEPEPSKRITLDEILATPYVEGVLVSPMSPRTGPSAGSAGVGAGHTARASAGARSPPARLERIDSGEERAGAATLGVQTAVSTPRSDEDLDGERWSGSAARYTSELDGEQPELFSCSASRQSSAGSPLSPAPSFQAMSPPSLTAFRSAGMSSSSDLSKLRDSVSTEMRRMRRRRGATGSPVAALMHGGALGIRPQVPGGSIPGAGSTGVLGLASPPDGAFHPPKPHRTLSCPHGMSTLVGEPPQIAPRRSHSRLALAPPMPGPAAVHG